MFALCVLGCSSEDNGGIVVDSVFEIEQTNLTHELDLDAVVLTIPVKTDLEKNDWNVKSNVDWCEAGKSTKGNGITIVVEANEDARMRTAVVTVTSTVKNYEIRRRDIFFKRFNHYAYVTIFTISVVLF